MAQDVAGVLLDPRARRATRFARLLVAKDAFALADAAATGALHQARQRQRVLPSRRVHPLLAAVGRALDGPPWLHRH